MTVERDLGVRLERTATYPSLGEAERMRARLDGADRSTTLHVARWPLARFAPKVVPLEPAEPVERWCREHAIGDALSGGFFSKPLVHPLGELVVDGRPRRYVPFHDRWRTGRAAMAIDPDGALAIAPRDELDVHPEGSLLQAGPLLVRDGSPLDSDEDPEGFSTGCAQFDSDITAEPLPRVALGVTHDEQLLAVAVDGRGPEDDGLLLSELAAVLVELGVRDALNLDGGSSSSLVTAGVRRNVPRDDSGNELVDGYFTTSAIVVLPR